MTPRELQELLATGGERYDVEYKRPGRRADRRYFSGVARAVLAMANRRDGGTVVIGVEEKRGSPAALIGLSPDELTTWRADDVRDALATYAEPSVDVEVLQVALDDKTAVVIRVREFADVPVLCRKDGEDVREGALYVRSRRKPESIEVPRQAEMRDLIELATEKRLVAFLRTAAAAGIRPGSAPGEASPPSDTARFDQQRSAMQMSGSTKARKRGFWQVSIHPQRFVQQRVPNILELAPIMRAAAVSYRGWPYPSVLTRLEPSIGDDWIQADVDDRIHVERWRMYQSGHFVQDMGLWEDWFEQDFLTRAEQRPTASETLGVDFTIGTLTEIFEFAARLAASAAGAEAMVISLSLHGLKGRRLELPPGRAGFSTPRVANIDSYRFEPRLMARDALLTDPRAPAVDAALELFRRFGWDAGAKLVASFQPPLQG